MLAHGNQPLNAALQILTTKVQDCFEFDYLPGSMSESAIAGRHIKIPKKKLQIFNKELVQVNEED